MQVKLENFLDNQHVPSLPEDELPFITDSDIAEFTQSLATRSHRAVFFPADANNLAGFTYCLILEVMKLRKLVKITPVVNVMCETVDTGVTGTTRLDVKRVELQDDGSFTAVVDHWPHRGES